MSGCPAETELERYYSGEMSEEESVGLEAHLKTCHSCVEKDAVYRHEQSLIDELRRLSPAEIADLNTPLPDGKSFPWEKQAALKESVVAGSGGDGFSIDGYEIVGELHRGGQGVVYRALQHHTQRDVAIKVLIDGAYASPSAKRRFEREIELAAQLSHPNIIAVFHSGLSSEGRQYCVMDFLEGVPLDRYVREQKLTLEDILCQFAKICDAVMYAHQRGIIHRDLKPSNILVDEAGDPKILDFGLAKQMLDGAETTLSMTGQVFGTLPYMSPEQAGGRPGEVDTRTDIYALGVILYQLLTGHYPYPVDGQLVDVIRHIAETPPTPPSRRWTVDSGVTKRAARTFRSTGCPIDDEVQTIVLKALAKEKERRYQSAAELARDLRHYLAGEPIEARRSGGLYVLRKAVRRHKLPFAMATALFFLAVGSTLIVSVMYRRQSALNVQVIRERDRAVRAEKKAANERDVAIAARREADDERDNAKRAEARASHRFKQVRELAGSLVFDFHDQIKNLKGATPAREFLVQTMLEYLNSLAAEAADDPSLQKELAMAYLRVGDVQGNPFDANLGDTDGAMKSYHEGLKILESLVELEQDKNSYMRTLAISYDKVGRVQLVMGQSAEALTSFKNCLKLNRAIAKSIPDDPYALRGLAISHDRIGRVHSAMGNMPEALASFKSAHKTLEAYARVSPKSADAKRGLALSYVMLGDIQKKLSRTEEALTSFRSALKINQELIEDLPDHAIIQRDLAVSYERLGDLLAGAPDEDDQTEETIACYKACLKIRESFVHADPNNADAQRGLAVIYNKLGDFQSARDQWDDALDYYQRSLKIVEALSDGDPENVNYRRDVGATYWRLGNIHVAIANDQQPSDRQVERWRKARMWLAKSQTLYAAMQDANVAGPSDLEMLAMVSDGIVKCDDAIEELVLRP
ncbi:MAG: protein kinase [Phycisphaerales bacterium]|nr:protein kinase [Phycisphaerales bacterium]